MPAADHIDALRAAAQAATPNHHPDLLIDLHDLTPATLALAADLVEMDRDGTVDLDTWPAARLLVLAAVRHLEEPRPGPRETVQLVPHQGDVPPAV